MANGLSGHLDLLVLVVAGLALLLMTSRLAVLAFAPQLRAHRPFRLRRGHSVRDGICESVLWMAWCIGMLGNGLGTGSGWFSLLSLVALVGILVLAFRSRRKARAG